MNKSEEIVFSYRNNLHISHTAHNYENKRKPTNVLSVLYDSGFCFIHNDNQVVPCNMFQANAMLTCPQNCEVFTISQYAYIIKIHQKWNKVCVHSQVSCIFVCKQVIIFQRFQRALVTMTTKKICLLCVSFFLQFLHRSNGTSISLNSLEIVKIILLSDSHRCRAETQIYITQTYMSSHEYVHHQGRQPLDTYDYRQCYYDARLKSSSPEILSFYMFKLTCEQRKTQKQQRQPSTSQNYTIQ